MKALIMRDDAEAAAGCAKALMDKGFQVACVENRHIAQALLRIEPVDLLIMDERVDGRLTHALALSAERRHPYINTILMTDRPGVDTDELYDLIPSLYALTGVSVAPEIVAQLAMSGIEDFAQAEARVGRLSAADLAKAALPTDDDFMDDLADWEDDLVDEIVLVTDETPDRPISTDMMLDEPAVAARHPFAAGAAPDENACDPDSEDKADLPHFGDFGSSCPISAPHLAYIRNNTETRTATL